MRKAGFKKILSMKKKFLPTTSLFGMKKRAHKVFLTVAFCLTFVFNSYAHRVEPFVFSCPTTPGSAMTIDAIVQFSATATFYQWQYKDNTGIWKCFINGTNVINGANFTVSGSTSANTGNDAPLLTINAATAALEDVLVRLLLSEVGPPCGAPLGTNYGGDDLEPELAKNLRLHYFSNASLCPPNSYGCVGNVLFNAAGYYGGFENKTFNIPTGLYTSTNFGATAGSSDFSLGSAGVGRYQDINSPLLMDAGFAAGLAPHTGNYQMVIKGSPSTTARAWFKTGVSVTPGASYFFSVFVARVDNTDPIINLDITAGAVVNNVASFDMSAQPVGNWWRIQGQYTAPAGVTSVTLSIRDGRTGGLNNYTLDDLCFRACPTCIPLPVQSLELRSSLQGSTVGLKWVTVDEVNTSKFIVQRSTDGINYSDIASKPAVGQSRTSTEYQLSDDIQSLLQSTIIYYRIKAVDADGKFSYSNVVPVKLSKSGGVQIWPNPFVNDIRISYTAAANTSLDVRVIDNAGRTVSQTNYSVSRGLNQLSVSGVETLSPGVYIIRITDKNTNESFVQKLSK
jgi:Secretion system C-terminal sorting domain